MKKRKLEQMEQDWERAVEQAQERETREHALAADELNNAAGMQIRSGVKAGEWIKTYTQSMTCGCPS